jgi:phospholipid transport system substrate-binding protein
MRHILKEFFRSTMLDPNRLRRLLTAGALSLAIAGTSGTAAAVTPAASPSDFVATVGQRVVEVLGAAEMESEQRSRHFRDIFVHALDLDTMGRRVLGRHWRNATPAQRDRYIELFRKYVINLYAAQLGGYRGETFTVVRQQQLRENESMVMAHLKRQTGQPLSMNFRVRQENSRLKIIDVTIAGVSLIVTKRSEFDAIVRREGLDGLMRRLDAKQASALLDRRQVVSFIAEAMGVLQSGANVLFAQ